MFNIIISVLACIVCCIHVFKYGIEDRYDIDFLIILILLSIMFIYNIFG